MANSQNLVDVIYLAACALDARFTRICVASIRYFYPDVPIKILAGGVLRRGLVEELQKYWNVGVADLPRGDYGWGFVKLEPLFSPFGQRFLVLDSDTVLTGPVLRFAQDYDVDMIVDDEEQEEERSKEIYYDWTLLPNTNPHLCKPAFVFNTGQWIGRSGLFRREDFSELIEWGKPPRLKNALVFKNGDQGVLNYVVNEFVRSNENSVARVPLMRWPGNGMDDLNIDSVTSGDAPALVIHWAGMKKACLSAMVGADLLTFFEKRYYERIPGGEMTRSYAGICHALSHWLNEIRIRVSMRMKMIRDGLIRQGIRA